MIRHKDFLIRMCDVENVNASDLMEDDIEAKNKRLMEREKTFVPSFDMRWN